MHLCKISKDTVEPEQTLQLSNNHCRTLGDVFSYRETHAHNSRAFPQTNRSSFQR